MARVPRKANGREWKLLALIGMGEAPLDLRIVGRMLLHAALVGAAAGLVGAAFFFGLEHIQRVVLERLAGYSILRAHGERIVGEPVATPFRPWLLFFLPGLGALVGAFIGRFAPETRGGGGDQMIHAFHHENGAIRPRVIWVKALASIFTLGTGGAGGREGPTMQIGGALGSTVGSLLGVTPRERRILMVAGVAAGMAAVFRTPLGAALLAVEVLYRDDFEADALIPAILASVVAYSIVISLFGESTLFAHAPRYAFHAEQLPLYALLAIVVAGLAAVFVAVLRGVQRISQRLPVPDWVRPAIGGLALGLFSVPVVFFVSGRIGIPGQGLGILGGGYGAAQMAITGSPWITPGWRAVELLLLLCGAKLLAASLTIGSGGSAGDFAPSLVIGGIFGGAFGHAAQILLADPNIDPGAFALVGMGTFYGGIAHVPISALILVSELAGSYDLLVPMMLASGIAFVALRKRSLYEAQLGTKSESPIHRAALAAPLMQSRLVEEVMSKGPWITFSTKTRIAELMKTLSGETRQETFPVLDDAGLLKGLITHDALRTVSSRLEEMTWAIAADLMRPSASVLPKDDLRKAAQTMLGQGLREIPVIDAEGHIVGLLDEDEAARAYLTAFDNGGVAPKPA